MKVLGLDPSKNSAGGAIVDDGDLTMTMVWKPDDRKSDAFNLHMYFKRVRQVIRAEKPDMACVESLSVERNAKTTRVVSHYQAASVLACKEEGLLVIEARVSSARREALGNGGMGKEEAHKAVKKMFPGHKFKNIDAGGTDETDATVLAVAAPGLAEL